VVVPAPVLPDERRPRGVARALEQAGLRKKTGPAGAVAPAGEPEEEAGEEDAE
jgi:hypothetical protein